MNDPKEPVPGSIGPRAFYCHSNGRTSRAVVVRVRTKTTASKCETNVSNWVLSCITPLDPAGHGRVVCGIRHEDYEDDLLGQLNELVFVLYMDTNGGSLEETLPVDSDDPAMEDLLVNTWTLPPTCLLSADALRENLMTSPAEGTDTPHPPCVLAAGVSALPPAEVKGIWMEIISLEPDSFCLAGKGEMVHPMYCDFDGNGWSDIREWGSFKFSWKDAPEMPLLDALVARTQQDRALLNKLYLYMNKARLGVVVEPSTLSYAEIHSAIAGHPAIQDWNAMLTE